MRGALPISAVPQRPKLLAGERLPPAPRQKRSRAKRERLKTAALALFGDKGFERTSVNDICARAGLAVGSFYLHFRSKRQLLLVLMDDLLVGLSQVELAPPPSADTRGRLRQLLSQAFARDLHFLGVYRAWREAALRDPGLAKWEREIHAWTTARVLHTFKLFHKLPGARSGVDLPALARVMDTFFWSLLGRALHSSRIDRNQWADAATHLIYHALFKDTSAEGRFA